MPSPVSPGESLVSERDPQGVAFGKYRLLRLLARGGMGEVYLARLVGELGFEKHLVIKTILPELASDTRFIELFAAEAKTAVALSHGNIVPIYELGRTQETFYIVMGYVDGPSVNQLLATYRAHELAPTIEVALHITREVLTGLAYAHTEAPGRPVVVHRDISPRNILIDRSGQVRIVDFGIALAANVKVEMRAGSTGYMAPEQARAVAADPRADVFSVACVLYELITLERAFPKEGVWASPDLNAIPEDLRELLSAALAIDPHRRPRDAGEFLHMLGPVIGRRAATFGDVRLAQHLHDVFPKGWDPATRPATAGGLKRSGRAATQTFATRLTAVTNVAADSDGSLPPVSPAIPKAANDPQPSATVRRWWLGLLFAAGFAGSLVVLFTRQPEVIDPQAIAAEQGGEQPEPRTKPTQPPKPNAGLPAPNGPDSVEPQRPPTQAKTPSKAAPDLVAQAVAPQVHHLTVTPTGARVAVGGTALPAGSSYEIPRPAAEPVSVSITHPGYKPTRFKLGPANQAPTAVTLAKLKPKPPGFLKIISPTVEWAEVHIDGRKIGQTPLFKQPLAPGPHRVEVRCVSDVCGTGRTLLATKVQVKSGETLSLTAR